MPETMKLIGSTKTMITKDEYGENVPHLGTTEIVLIHCNTGNKDYEKNLRVLYTFVSKKLFGE